MKKILLTIGLFSALCVFAEDTEIYSKIFVSRFYKCIPCTMQQSVTIDDSNVQITRRIAGWHEHQCSYKETVRTNSKTTNAECEFTREQVNELVAAMQKDPAGTGDAKKAWDKFMQNSDVCKID